MECSVKILILEHEPHDLELLQYGLKKGGLNYVSTIVQTREEYIQALNHFGPDIILSDFSLPTFDGLSAYRIKQEVYPEIPFMIVSGTIGEEKAVDLIKMGVTDYIMKERMYQIAPKVVRALNEAKERKQKAIAEEKLKQKEEQLKKIINQSLDVICTLDEAGRFVEVGAASSHIWGYSPEELEGHQLPTLVYQADQEKTLAVIAKVQKGLAITNFDNRVVRQDGQLVPMSWSARWDAADKLMYCIARDATEALEAARQLEEQNQHMVNTFESITTGFCTIDRNWVCRYWNKEAEHILGLDRTEVLNRNIWKVFTDALGSKFYTEYHRVMNEGVQASFEEYLPSADAWFGIKAYPSKDGISVFFQDITESRRLKKLNQLEKEALDLYASRKSSLADIISFLLKGINKIHPDLLSAVLRVKKGKLSNWSSPLLPRSLNKSLKNLPLNLAGIGSGATTFLYTKVLTADQPQDSLWDNFLDLAADHQLQTCILYPIRDDSQETEMGVLVTYLQSCRHLKKSEERTIKKVIHILKNIIESKLAENAIRKSEKVRRLIMDSSMDAIVCIDTSGAVTLWNPQAKRIFGWEESEILGKKIADYILPARYRQVYQESLTQYLETGKHPILNKLVEVTAINRRQEEFPIELTTIPIRQEGTEIFCAFIRDITERKEAEARQQKMTEELYRQNKDLQQFTYIVSHNLRVPVANALGLTSLLTKTNKNTEIFDLSLTHLKTSVSHLDTVLRDMNTILSIRDRKEVIDKEYVVVAEVLREVFLHLQDALKRCGAQARIQIPEDLQVSASRPYLYSIFQNLLSNAIKYRSETRELSILVSCEQQPDGSKTISFADNGSGFDLEKAGPHVFKLYKRFHTNKEGRGIGLHLVKTHVETMGGQIEVQSQVNVGTTFFIRLK